MRNLLASSALLATATILPAQYTGTLQIVPAGGSGVFIGRLQSCRRRARRCAMTSVTEEVML